MSNLEREPSYYEVALTHRQVVVGFVFVLACVVAAFLAGVWIGRDAAPAPATQMARAAPPETPAEEARLERLTFFGERSAAPAPRAARPEPSTAPAAESPPAVDPAAEGMARTLEAEMESHREPEPAVAEPEPAPTVAAPAPAEATPLPAQPGTRVRRAQPAAEPLSPAPEAAPAVPADTAASAVTAAAVRPFFIQVYSSTNGTRAREIAGRLRRSGFEVRVLDTPMTGGTTYRVRVGPYANRDLADRTAARLRREFRLDTWVTDQP